MLVIEDLVCVEVIGLAGGGTGDVGKGRGADGGDALLQNNGLQSGTAAAEQRAAQLGVEFWEVMISIRSPFRIR